jgi:poly(hydroxyalkanoate) depolymerase family esterase
MGRTKTAGTVALALALVCLVAPAADAKQKPGKTQSFTYAAGDVAFPYLVHTPRGYSRKRPVPLVVMTHGCQTTANEQMRATRYNQVANREGFVVLYPDIDETGTQQPGPLRNCWRFFDGASWHRDGGDAGALAGMTREVMARKRIDPERVYMVGISAGGFMTSIMAAAYPDLYAAVVVTAAGAYADPTCLFVNPATRPVAESAQLAYEEMGVRARVVPRLVMGGDADQGIPPQCADKALEQGLRTNNLVISGSQDGPLPLTPSEVHPYGEPGRYESTVSTYRDPAGCVIGERLMIHGMNHFWPGGSAKPAWANFTDPKAPDGAPYAWNFLSKYRKAATSMPCAEARGPAE